MGNTHTHFAHPQFGDCCQIKIRKCKSVSEMCCKVHFATRDTGEEKMWSLTEDQLHRRLQTGKLPMDTPPPPLCLHTLLYDNSLHPFYNLLCDLRLSDQKQMNREKKMPACIIIMKNKSFGDSSQSLQERYKQNTAGVLAVK